MIVNLVTYGSRILKRTVKDATRARLSDILFAPASLRRVGVPTPKSLQCALQESDFRVAQVSGEFSRGSRTRKADRGPIGDKRKCISAIVVIDEGNVVREDHKVQFTTFASLTRPQEVVMLIHEEVTKVNAQLARIKNIRKFRILGKKLDTEDGEVTPTMKVKRKFSNAHYREPIESMYRE